LPTVAFVSPKGGAGKTTGALLLALGLADMGLRVALIDSDPNRPLVHWASLPDRPDKISVHPAPTEADLPDALREAKTARAEWIILDTEGSPRPGLAFAAVQPDLVITPLAASALESIQTIKAAEMTREAAKRTRRPILHRALFTRMPAAIKPRSLKAVIAQLRAAEIEILATAIIEKEAYRTLFALGGGFDELERNGVYGLTAARVNAGAYVSAVMGVLDEAAA
jgi:chromosome partitioning protein